MAISGTYFPCTTVTIFVTRKYGNREKTSERAELIETPNGSELRRKVGKSVAIASVIKHGPFSLLIRGPWFDRYKTYQIPVCAFRHVRGSVSGRPSRPPPCRQLPCHSGSRFRSRLGSRFPVSPNHSSSHIETTRSPLSMLGKHHRSLPVSLSLNRFRGDFGSGGWGFKSLRAHHISMT